MFSPVLRLEKLSDIIGYQSQAVVLLRALDFVIGEKQKFLKILESVR